MTNRIVRRERRGPDVGRPGLRWCRRGVAAAWGVLACWACMVGVASAEPVRPVEGLSPVRVYAGVNRPIEVLLAALDGAEAGGERGGVGVPIGREVLLLDARSGRVLERSPVADSAERVDLAALFPVLWTTRDPAVLVAQLAEGGRPVGAGVILRPLVEPERTRDALTGLIERAIDGRRWEVLRDLSSLPSDRVARLRQAVEEAGGEVGDGGGVGDGAAGDAAGGGGEGANGASAVLSGYRLHRDRQVVLDTTLGALVLRLRDDLAPNTCAWFASLVADGFYDGTAFHRIVPRDRAGHPFIAQAGDPTWTGHGGAGVWVDFERSGLEHDVGVVSLARRAEDPNSNGSQFFISLSRAGCERLDGRYVSFAEVVEGGEVLGLLLSTPVGPRDPGVAGSPADRPLDPPVIVRAWLRDAPAYPERPSRVRGSDVMERAR